MRGQTDRVLLSFERCVFIRKVFLSVSWEFTLDNETVYNDDIAGNAIPTRWLNILSASMSMGK